MAKWEGDDFFTADDSALLRAIQIVEGKSEGYPHLTGFDSAIHTNIIQKSGFKILKENEHLRTLLRAFLEANIRVTQAKKLLAAERERGFLGKINIFRKGHVKTLETTIKDLEGPRDEAFKKYEMLRRLTDWENPLLKRVAY